MVIKYDDDNGGDDHDGGGDNDIYKYTERQKKLVTSSECH